MSNGKVERMIGNVEAAVKRRVLQDGEDLDSVLWKSEFGYRCRSRFGGVPPYEIMFGSPPRLLNRSKYLLETRNNMTARHVELDAANNIRAERIDSSMSPSNDA